MAMIIPVAYLVGMVAVLVGVARRTVRFVRTVPPAMPAARDTRVLWSRFVRVVVGLVLVAGFAKIVVDACLGQRGVGPGLGFAWETAGLAGLAAAIIGPLAVRHLADDAWPTASFVLPVAGLALLLPISLHGVVFWLRHETISSFDDWCGLSVIGAGVATLVFSALFAARALSLARTGRSHVSVGEIFWLTTIASAFPFFILGMAMTAATGLFVLPAIYLIDRLALREHAATAIALPRAIVSPCRA
ncbi:MAG TPA: hypothetical protein VLT45_22660 [Kofleriaceae bacterium]|nr:hypothetical protein [Kofleriaceae bacterium]